MASFNFAGVGAVIDSLARDAGRWQALGNQIAVEARRTAPVDNSPDRKPGPHLKDTIEMILTFDHRGPCINVGSRLPQSVYVNKGTVAHPIDPVNATVLRFTGRSGTVVFATHVNHPGTKPNGYLIAAARRVLTAGKIAA